MSDPTLTAKAVFDTQQYMAASNAMAKEIQALGRSMRTDLGAGAKEAGQHAGAFTGYIKDMRKEGVQAQRMLGFYGAAFQDIGFASKGATKEIGGFALAIASGSWVLAGLEGARMLAKFLHESGAEAEKLKEIRVKFATQGEQKIFDSLTKLNVERMRAEGRSEKEIRAYEAIRGNESAVLEIRKEQAPLMERIAELTAKRASIEATIQNLGKDDVARRKNLQEAASAHQGKIDDLSKSYGELQDVIDKSMGDAKKAGEIEGQAADAEKKRKDESRSGVAQLALDNRNAAKQTEELNRAAMASAKIQGDAWEKKREAQKKVDQEAFEGRVEMARKEIAEEERLAQQAARTAMDLGRTAGSAIGSSLAAVITGTGSVADAFAEMGSAAIDAVVDMVTKTVEAYAVQAAAAAAAANASIPVVGIAIAAAAAAAMGALVKGLLGGLKGRADGGPVYGGTPYMVGERGPELFMPGSSGTIIPNDALSGARGGGGRVEVHVHPVDAAHFERMLNDNAGALDRAIRRSRRNGRL